MHFKKKMGLLNRNNLSQYYGFGFPLFFDQINAAFVSIRDYFQKLLFIWPTPNFWMIVYQSTT